MSRCRRSRIAAALMALALVSGAAGCAARLAEPDPGTLVRAQPARVGVYRGTVSDLAERRTRRFRLLLVAEAPDRVHAEIVSPIGRTELIVDGGTGTLSVALPRERVAFTGPASVPALEELLGVPVSLEGLVAALLSGESPGGGVRVEREGPRAGLPERFGIGTDLRSLDLELKRVDRLAAPPAGLGTGAPPAGFERRELAELRWSWFDDEQAPAAGPAGPGG